MANNMEPIALKKVKIRNLGTIDFLEYAVIKAPEMNNNDRMVAMIPNLGC